jgi:hypothetical protein
LKHTRHGRSSLRIGLFGAIWPTTLAVTRSYVTIRKEQRDGEEVWRKPPSVAPGSSPRPPGFTRKDGSYRIIGAAWGAPIAQVEVRIGSGPWQLPPPGRPTYRQFVTKLIVEHVIGLLHQSHTYRW